MALFKKKMPRGDLVSILADRGFKNTAHELEAFSMFLGGDQVGTPLTTESRFSKELVALLTSICGGGLVPGVLPNAPDHLQKGVVELGIALASAGGNTESYVQYLAQWKDYRLGSPTDPLVASLTNLFIDRANDYVTIHQPIGLERHIVRRMIKQHVDLSIKIIWDKLVSEYKFVE